MADESGAVASGAAARGCAAGGDRANAKDTPADGAFDGGDGWATIGCRPSRPSGDRATAAALALELWDASLGLELWDASLRGGLPAVGLGSSQRSHWLTAPMLRKAHCAQVQSDILYVGPSPCCGHPSMKCEHARCDRGFGTDGHQGHQPAQTGRQT